MLKPPTATRATGATAAIIKLTHAVEQSGVINEETSYSSSTKW